MPDFLKVLLFPIAILYGMVIFLRNKCYDFQILKSTEFKLPIISVGNLTTGGTGKTPHTEYLIHLLKQHYKVAALSRGYGRKTKHFIEVQTDSDFWKVGDEPLQIKRKFSDVTVVVNRKRVAGVKKMLINNPELELIILDDAFQHRSIKPGFSIVLTDYKFPYWNNYMLPSGTLREQAFEIKRADLIIVTKTPPNLSPIEQRMLKEQINPLPYQDVFLSYIKYGQITPYYNHLPLINMDDICANNYEIVLFAGIGNPDPLVDFMDEKKFAYQFIKFPDHHNYTKANLLQIKKAFETIVSNRKIILTTEKDAMRLTTPFTHEIMADLPIYYLPIEIDFHNEQHELFNKKIMDYVRKNTIFKQMK